MTALERFRESKDQFFKGDPHSPLLPDQKEDFEGLNYYPENPDLRFNLEIARFDEQNEIEMTTSTGDVAAYKRWGQITFPVEGEEVKLTVYAAVGGGGFFLPFMDGTNGSETYDGGRYLEIDPRPDGSFDVDFNLAYNPYCAYNEYWSCPIPPKENRLKVRIEAGEKAFKSEVVEG